MEHSEEVRLSWAMHWFYHLMNTNSQRNMRDGVMPFCRLEQGGLQTSIKIMQLISVKIEG